MPALTDRAHRPPPAWPSAYRVSFLFVGGAVHLCFRELTTRKRRCAGKHARRLTAGIALEVTALKLRVADARRRFGETSWQVYGQEAAAASGALLRAFGIALDRRDDAARLNKLAGIWLGDAREWLMPRGLEKIEDTLWRWRSGLTSRDAAERETRTTIQEDAWPSKLEIASWNLRRRQGQKIEPGERRPPGPTDSREFHEKHDMARQYRLSTYAKQDIPALVSGYPFLEFWLEELRKHKRCPRPTRRKPGPQRSARGPEQIGSQQCRSTHRLVSRATAQFRAVES
ncbi:MAG TPA: hypothetical protein DGG94_13090 [Micromonosporaceae bacterium]|nr:hypothetical protein [Micromonosporaceae bacterium]HCU50715.1 hypothetical protein [Micromonosporaceae bacterium]